MMILLLALLAAQEHTKDTLDDVKAGVAKKSAVLIDVREQAEWDAGHLDGALLLPLSWLRTASAEDVAGKVPKGAVLYNHCRAGRRVFPASDLLKKLGYDARPLKQGYEELKKAGFPVVEPKP